MAKHKILTEALPMIYCYTIPGYTPKVGWCKIGYTEKNVTNRIHDQTHTAGVQAQEEWRDIAVYGDGTNTCFTDHDFHAYLELRGIEREVGTEWFKIEPKEARDKFDEFRRREHVAQAVLHAKKYQLRHEQGKAVYEALEYANNHESGEFLLNAKPRFGKSLTVYDFCKKKDAKRVLIVTNRPAIANSWYSDYVEYVGRDDLYYFVSETDELKGKEWVLTWEQFERAQKAAPNGIEYKCIYFLSLQNLKGSIYFGGNFDKLKEVKNIEWDILVIDEAHEGVDTYKTDAALAHIKRKHSLHLSGTPFKALKNDKFDEDAIFNWTYVDEQIAKEAWNEENGTNPYFALPTLHMHTYRMANIITGAQGPNLNDDDAFEYVHKLNEFFATNKDGKFIHEADVDTFLDALVNNEHFPFYTQDARDELAHTFWLMYRVADAKAMCRKLQAHPVFKDYHIVVAAGDGKVEGYNEREEKTSYNAVVNAIKQYDKTITLSVGQLTTGVTIPEWSGVMILSERNSPAQYMQAAFRAQNPCLFIKNRQWYRKENAYVFDFNPEKSLTIVEQFANDLCSQTANGRGTYEDRKHNIEQLLRYFPVNGENENGEMVELTPEQVLSIPRRIRSEEVVNRGFMSNMLFQNIHNVFRAPQEVMDMLNAFPLPPSNKKVTITSNTASDINLDADGNVNIPKHEIQHKGEQAVPPKKRETAVKKTTEQVKTVQLKDPDKERAKITSIIEAEAKEVISSVYKSADKNATPAVRKKVERQIKQDITDVVETYHREYTIKAKTAQAEIEEMFPNEDADTIKELVEEAQAEAHQTFMQQIKTATTAIINNAVTYATESTEVSAREKERDEHMDEVRKHLQSFSRTIPSFLMAYGYHGVTLDNFDTIIPDDVFKEVTGITLDNFRFLRDGGDYEDKQTGDIKHFDGRLFEPTVFNDSIERFLQKKEELRNYFDDTQAGDIFDYIPPQKTNQIFTPKNVVKMMADILEQENPGCFDNPENTFLDPYMKSGLYVAEIVKRLYNSPKMKVRYPDDGERLRHIFATQVYGLAPTKIIYEIALHFVLGFDENANIEKHNLRLFDATPYAQNGTLEDELQKLFFEESYALPEDSDITDFLDIMNVTYVDRRPNGGCLWIEGGAELQEIVDACKARNVIFTFKEAGAHATRYNPGWWTR